MNRLLIIPGLFVLGCSAVERADIATDVSTGLPGLATDAATGGTAGVIAGAVTLAVTVIAGYITRKFIQKKYTKPKE